MDRGLAGLFLILSLMAAAPLWAHEMRPAYLQITETEPGTYDVMWKVPALGDMRLSLYVRFPSDVEVVTPPVGGLAGGAYIERWRIRRPGGLAGTPVVIDGLAATYTDALVRVSLLNLKPQSILLKPEKPSFVIAADPSGWEVAGTYFRMGVEHILLGIDHLLFVMGLLILSRGLVLLVKTITSFTVGHSLSLALATFGVVRRPGAAPERRHRVEHRVLGGGAGAAGQGRNIADHTQPLAGVPGVRNVARPGLCRGSGGSGAAADGHSPGAAAVQFGSGSGSDPVCGHRPGGAGVLPKIRSAPAAVGQTVAGVCHGVGGSLLVLGPGGVAVLRCLHFFSFKYPDHDVYAGCGTY